MKNKYQRIRNFRINETLDKRLIKASELVGTSPSRLLRDFVRDGTDLIIGNKTIQESLRQRYT